MNSYAASAGDTDGDFGGNHARSVIGVDTDFGDSSYVIDGNVRYLNRGRFLQQGNTTSFEFNRLRQEWKNYRYQRLDGQQLDRTRKGDSVNIDVLELRQNGVSEVTLDDGRVFSVEELEERLRQKVRQQLRQ